MLIALLTLWMTAYVAALYFITHNFRCLSEHLLTLRQVITLPEVIILTGIVLFSSLSVARIVQSDESWMNLRAFEQNLYGSCYRAAKSGREICSVSYMDTTCYVNTHLVPPPEVEHAVFSLMYSLQYYNCTGTSVQRKWHSKESESEPLFDLNKSYYFLQYECEHGYEFLDEVKMLFCSNGEWLPKTKPKCVGKGACRRKNGGCSHICYAKNNVAVQCSCPEGMVLGLDGRQCYSIPYQESSEDDCKCFPSENSEVISCYCQKDRIPIGPPEMSITSEEPHELIPGESVILTCKAESYMTPKIDWETNSRMSVQTLNEIPSEWMDKKFLSKRTKFSNISRNTFVTCIGRSVIGENRTDYEIMVKEPGPAPHVSYIYAGLHRAIIWYQAPEIQTCPISMCFIYYTTNRNSRMDLWSRLSVEVDMPAFVLHDLTPNTKYFFRLRSLSDFRAGSYGPILSFKTSNLELHTEPTILKKDISRNTARIIWEPPPRYISKHIKEYTVYYSNDLHIPLYLQYSITVPGTEREVTIKNLEPLTNYYIYLKPQHFIPQFYAENTGIFDHFRTL